MIIKRTASAFFVSAGLLFGLTGATLASPTAAQLQAIRSACPSDFQSFCAGVSPGGSAALQCLEKNVAKLSSACQGAVKAVMPAASSATSSEPDSSATTDSSDDSSSSSDAASTGESQGQTKSSSQPAAAEPTVHLTLRQEIFLVREACGPEFRAYCGGIQLGGGNAVNCLRAHSSKLSGACKGAISDLMR